MLYAEARPLIASGDLLAFANPRFVSRLIRTWTGGSYSHVGIAWRYRDRVFVLAAREGYGVYNAALSTQLPAYWIKTGLAWTDAVDDLATSRLGLPYSYSDCARVALGEATHRPDEVCSVYAAMVLKAAGLVLPRPSYTPAGLVDAVMALGADMHMVSPDLSRVAAYGSSSPA